MKKNYKKLRKIGFALLASLSISTLSFGQYGCGSAVGITDGYTSMGITTPGNAGPEDWNDNPTGTSINVNYWDDDVYLFEYTAGATAEEISMTIFTRNGWNGIGIFASCSGVAFSDELDADGSTSSSVSKTVSAMLQAGQTVYIAVGQWGSPNDLDFDVTDFTVTTIACPAPVDLAITNLTATTVDLGWTEFGTATAWNVEYGAAGFSQGSGTMVNGTTTNPHNLTGLTPETVYEFYVQSDCGGTDQSNWVGPFEFTTPPTCPAPTDLDIQNLTATSVDLEWTEAGAATDWNIEYGTYGYTQGNGTDVATTTNPHSLTGLTPETTYDFYVQADCGVSDQSVWVGPFAFTTPPTCPAPTDLAITNLTTTSADLGWTNGGSETAWNVEYGAAGFTPGSGTPVSTTTNPHNLTGLTEETAYEFYVQADCGGTDQSTWAGPFAFTTPCNPYSIPYFEGFESGYTHNTNVDGCLTQESEAGTSTWTANNTLTSYNRSPRTGDWNAFLRYSNTDWMFIPVQLVGGTSYMMDVYARQDGSTATNAKVEISYGASGNAASMTNVIVAETGVVNNQYQLLSGVFTPVTSGVYYIGIKGIVNGSPWYLSVDDIAIYEAPSCLPTTDLVASNETQTSVDLDWTENNSATTWNIEYGPEGFTPGTGTVISGVTTNPYTVSGLNPSSTYDFYVQSDCGSGDLSSFGIETTATTLCGAVLAPYYEGFESGELPTCYENLSSNTSSSSTNNFWKFTGQADYGAANNGKAAGTFAWSDGSTPTPDSMMLITTEVDLTPLTTPYLGFEWFSNNTNNPGDNVPLIVSIHDGTSWILLDTLRGDSDEWQFASFDLAAYANTVVKVGFMTNQTTTTNDAYYNDILVDEIRIDDCITGQDGTKNVCRLDGTVDLNDNIVTAAMGGGTWHSDGLDIHLNDSIFEYSTLPSGSYELFYVERFACADTSVATINVYNESTAGDGQSITVCKNEPINLYAALSGNVDIGGDWYDFNGNLLPNSQPTSPSLAAQYNYSYITSNGVCPADTAVVEVNVDNCVWVSVEEEEFAEISVYPNPTTSVLNIVNPSNTSALRIEMLDMNGRVVMVENKALNNATEATLTIDHLEKGIYTLRVYNNEGQRTFKIVKQ
nr:fibronectin type III domain-containing protein [uncultured Brumimicrobium sp.]